MRISILDGFRGFFIVFMMVAHVNAEVNTMIGRINHHFFGWVEDAQGFIFISGVVVALVYGGIFLRKSGGAMRLAIWRRIRTIFSYQVTLILLFLGLSIFLQSYHHEMGPVSGYGEQPFAFTLASIFLVAGSMHMGILPMYIFFLMATPILIRLFFNGHTLSVVWLSVGLWLVAQTGLEDQLVSYAGGIAGELGHPISFGIYFNILGWQVIYVAGLAAGIMYLRGDLRLDALRGREHEVAVCVALLFIVLLGIFDRLIYWELISPEYSAQFLAENDRGDFPPIYLVAFALDLYVMLWIIVAGKHFPNTTVRMISDFVVWFFTRPALVMLGRHSLTLFTYHIVVVYVWALIFNRREVPELVGSAIVILSVASLFPVAYLLDQRRRKQRAIA